MMDSAHEITREQLYDLVWSKPATKVGEQFGVSGVAVAKACRNLNVPRPPRGYWAKLEFGKPVTKVPLPALKTGQRNTAKLGEFAEKRRADKKPSIATASQIAPDPATLLEEHFIVRQTRRALVGAQKSSRDEVLFPKNEVPHFALLVTKPALDRALAVLNQVAWHLEKNGFEFRPGGEKSSQYVLTMRETNTPIDLALREVTERYERDLSAKEKESRWIYDRWGHRATGRLRFVITEYFPEGSRKTWSDGKTQRLEDQVSDIVEGCIICAREKHQKELEWAEQRRRWDEEAKVRAEHERRLAEEQKRRVALREAAATWQGVANLRGFIHAAEQSLAERGQTTDQTSKWVSWARRVADELDPLRTGFLTRAADSLPH